MEVYLPTIPAVTYDQCRHRSDTPIPCPPVYEKVLELRRSHSHSTNDANQTFLAADLLIGDVLGQGFFGQAVTATYVKSGEQLVLKQLLSHDEHADNGFRREILILRSLSHPCILKYIGVLYRENALNLVTEYIEGGSLSSILLDLTVPLSWKQRISFARDIAAGMCYLHSVGVIHRDLNSHNCLVRKDHTVVVADLGLAKVIPHPILLDSHLLLDKPSKEEEPGDGATSARGRRKRKVSHQQRGGVVGNPYWMAPEMMCKGIYDEKADVFSYGIILCETIARVTADPDYMPRSMDFGLNVEAFHERFCEHAPEPYFMLAVLCSQLESENRPSFERAHLMCESLILHVEHAAAVPRDLRGSAIDFHQKLKEKEHGKGCKDVVISVDSGKISKQHQDIFTCQGHDNQWAKEKNSFQIFDLELPSSHTCICSHNEYNDICSTSGSTSDVDRRTGIRQTGNNSLHDTRQTKCGKEIIRGANGQNQLIKNCNKENIHRTNRQNRFTITKKLSTELTDRFGCLQTVKQKWLECVF
ncbi:hypothetical protein BsWGS_07595 [Bradybaena similaris]